MIAKITPAYLFQQYADDVNLQAFIYADNQIMQQYLDWLNAINLPIYTTLNDSNLLDFVGQSVYGIPRPTIQSGFSGLIGAYNTFAFNGGSPFNGVKSSSAGGDFVTDDIYKRVITWNFYKGDGQIFNFEWLKRRILRFIYGTNGQDVEISSVYGVSVTISGQAITINIETSSLLNPSIKDGVIFYGATLGNFYTLQTSVIANILKNALLSGACPLPFQYTYTVSVT